MLEQLKQQVYEANLLLPAHGLVVFTWGNASGVDRASGCMVIKPSGVAYNALRPEDMVVVELATGRVAEGALRPSSDTETHRVLYNAFPEIGGVVHTHSRWAASFALAGRGIAAMGTTQGDEFYGEVPCTRPLTEAEIRGAYEYETGCVIAETFNGKAPLEVPGCLVRNHGPFTWGRTPLEAAENAVVLEEAAFMNFHALMLDPAAGPMPQALLDKHYLRKHGQNAYYGQK